ncbi:aminotransferase [Chromatiales bacterium (ex Bugula neritina AB1)]|nr:aminotransferase [Chromatiales bacterium (ex Bugula neritina AB1)]
MNSFAPWPNYSAEEADIVSRVLLSNKVNYWTGKEARFFEAEFATFFGTRYSVALANGTLALDLALYALDVGVGDEVVVTPRSFIASASSVVNAGARAVFADIDRDSQNITAETIEAVITDRTKAIICVHLAGWPCDMASILDLAGKHGIKVIEDCAQAHGAAVDGKSIGTFGDISAWSFCQDKIMTTGGEGGMVTTDCQKLYEKMWSFKDHGKSIEKVKVPSKSTAFKWIHDSIGTNWRLTEMQSALGRFQLSLVRDWVTQRRANGEALSSILSQVEGIRTTIPDSSTYHAYYKYYFFVELDQLRDDWDRNRVVAEIHARGIPCFTGTCPEIYREKAFSDLYGEQSRLEVASELGETSVMLNVHPGITVEQSRQSAEVVRDVMHLAHK